VKFSVELSRPLQKKIFQNSQENFSPCPIIFPSPPEPHIQTSPSVVNKRDIAPPQEKEKILGKFPEKTGVGKTILFSG
jgi:hypothetical protein